MRFVSRGEQIVPAPMTRDEREAFLAAVHVGVLSADEPGRGPLSVPVWYLYEAGGEIVIVTRPEARKARLLGLGARVSFCVQSEEMPPKYVTIQGRVVSAAPADVARDLKPIVRKYLGAQQATPTSTTRGRTARTRSSCASGPSAGTRGISASRSDPDQQRCETPEPSAPELEHVDHAVGRPRKDQHRAAARDRADRRIGVERGQHPSGRSPRHSPRPHGIRRGRAS